jgi:hypothetical protein
MSVARDGSGPPPSIGDVVGRIGDLSGNGFEAVAASDAGRPRLELIGDRPALRFDGVDDALVLSTMTLGPSWSLFLAAEQFADGSFLGCQYPDGGVNVHLRFRPHIISQPLLEDGSPTYLAHSGVSGRMAGEIWAEGTACGLTFDGAPPKSRTTSSPVLTAPSALVIGDQRVPPRAPAGAALFGLVAYSEAPPSAQQRQDAMSWVRARQGGGQ